MRNSLQMKRPQSISVGGQQTDIVAQVLELLLSSNLTADDLPKLPTTKVGAGWWAVAGAGALAVGGIVLGAVALSLAGVLLADAGENP